MGADTDLSEIAGNGAQYTSRGRRSRGQAGCYGLMPGFVQHCLSLLIGGRAHHPHRDRLGQFDQLLQTHGEILVGSV